MLTTVMNNIIISCNSNNRRRQDMAKTTPCTLGALATLVSTLTPLLNAPTITLLRFYFFAFFFTPLYLDL